MFRFGTTGSGRPGRRRGLTTFRALWPELRLGLLEERRRAQLDWVKPHEDARVTRWAHLASAGRLLDRRTA